MNDSFRDLVSIIRAWIISKVTIVIIIRPSQVIKKSSENSECMSQVMEIITKNTNT